MLTLRELCKPRDGVFDTTQRDTALDLTDLLQKRISAKQFFQENFRTQGMSALFQAAFRRLSGQPGVSVIKLTQAMGGGKTHNLIALGLLADSPELRKKILGSDDPAPNLGRARVVGFTGRESDVPHGIWGAIADQLGKKDQLRDYYSPLRAPGQAAWTELLRGDPLLILLDELPPYFVAARSVAIGNSDLADVTTTALANLLVAVNKDELRNVCVVITDLKGSYTEGSELIARAMENLGNEVNRTALPIEPVRLNDNELYDILRTRLFETLPSEDTQAEVAQAYAQSVRTARQMDITNASPEGMAARIKESYPFHPALKDLYARFRENPGFQQTRGLIRLMRIVVSRMWQKGGMADEKHLIAAHDLVLNDPETLAELQQINPSLTNAISHDIASNGGAVAEAIDEQLGGRDARDTATLLVVSSLANIPNALHGLTLSEIVENLCAPGRDLARLRQQVLGSLTTRAWYLHTNRDGRLYFKDVQNLAAKLHTIALGYNQDSSKKELRERLEVMFKPSRFGDCYQDVLALPALDDIKLRSDRVTLVVFEPRTGVGLTDTLKQFFEQQEYRNRVLFLSGQRGSMETLLERTAEAKAIDAILQEMADEKVPESDPQLRAARELRDKLAAQLLSAARESFTTLYYPSLETSTRAPFLRSADFEMAFTSNQYNGEEQVRSVLKDKKKFTEEVESDAFRAKVEQKLFTQQQMKWSEVKRRAGTNADWQLHRPDALDRLRDTLVGRDLWRKQGEDYVDKGPFPPSAPEVRVQQLTRNEDTGEVTLRLTAVHGDQILYEVGESDAPTVKVSEPRDFKTRELVLSFRCVDSTGKAPQGPVLVWRNAITLKSRQFQQGREKMVELRASPPAPIVYSTNGSDPRKGARYTDPFVVPGGTVKVLALAEKDGVISEVHVLDIDWSQKGGVEVDKARPATWKRRHEVKTSRESFELLAKLKKHQAVPVGPRISVTAGGRWMELSTDNEVALPPERIEHLVDELRGSLTAEKIEVELDFSRVRFAMGQNLLDFVADAKTELRDGEVVQ
jgi:molybdopterin converting factor small subunit